MPSDVRTPYWAVARIVGRAAESGWAQLKGHLALNTGKDIWDLSPTVFLSLCEAHAIDDYQARQANGDTFAYAEYVAWHESLSPDRKVAQPIPDLDDLDACWVLMMRAGLAKLTPLMLKLREDWTCPEPYPAVHEGVSPRSSRPELDAIDGDIFLAEMMASMQVGF